MWATKQGGKKSGSLQRWTENKREEMEGGREWRWMERNWITGEGQVRFTMGCHGSRIMLGSLPWEKLQDEGQWLQSVVLQNSAQRSPLQGWLISVSEVGSQLSVQFGTFSVQRGPLPISTCLSCVYLAKKSELLALTQFWLRTRGDSRIF